MQALSIHAGPRAMSALREHGLRPHDVRVIPAAAGGPKGLVLNPLDQFIFGDWLSSSRHTVHLLGASIGAWRMATACMNDPAPALAQMAHDYIHQDYEHRPGKAPALRHVSEVFGAKLQQRFGGREAEVLCHPRYRLHVFTSRGLHLLRREGRVRTPLGYLGAFAANAVSRRAMGGWLERVVFSDPREPLPLHLHAYRTHSVALSAANLRLSLLASCSIPFLLEAVNDIPGAPTGAYWDGGITDYHLHLDYAGLHAGAADDGGAPPGAGLSLATAGDLVPEPHGADLVLYPHFQPSVIPGWLDKSLKHRHRATAQLDNVVLLSPTPQWVASLPNGKLPDRADFKRYNDDTPARVAVWSRVVRESARLRDEFAAWVQRGDASGVQPLR
ncbi:MAG: phospholipase [Methylibium sp. NZG]|nr:MAG: phospholipase [Methylibium sp. NZG]